jgi:F-type H+-transporting ATPase subunit b
MNGLLLSAADVVKDLGIHLPVLAVQAFIFIVTFTVLRRLLFGRMMRFMTDREGEVDRALEAIRRDRAELERLTSEYEGHIARIEKEAYDRLQAVLKEALEARARISAEAQQKSAAEVKAALAEIGREKREALAALQKEVQTISREAVERVIGVPVDPSAAGRGR